MRDHATYPSHFLTYLYFYTFSRAPLSRATTTLYETSESKGLFVLKAVKNDPAEWFSFSH